MRNLIPLSAPIKNFPWFFDVSVFAGGQTQIFYQIFEEIFAVLFPSSSWSNKKRILGFIFVASSSTTIVSHLSDPDWGKSPCQSKWLDTRYSRFESNPQSMLNNNRKITRLVCVCIGYVWLLYASNDPGDIWYPNTLISTDFSYQSIEFCL